jgi:PAS domain-containing protein
MQQSVTTRSSGLPDSEHVGFSGLYDYHINRAAERHVREDVVVKEDHSSRPTNGQQMNGAIFAFAQHRQSLLRRAAEVLCADGFAAHAEQCEPLPRVTTLLASSLEALRVAEEELVEQNDSLESTRSELEEQVSYFQRLFDSASVPLLLTDTFGSVILANRAAVRLFKIADASGLLEEPLAKLIPLDQRSKFRNELSRVSLAERVTDWHFVIARRSDAPLEVSAAVEIVSGLGRDGGNALQWCLRPISTDPITSAATHRSPTASTALVMATADPTD